MWLLKLLSRLPLGILYLISDGIYFLLFYVVRYRRTVVNDNLRLAFPDKSPAELQRVASRFYHNLADATAETIKGLTISREELKKRVIVVNGGMFQEQFEKGEGLIIASCHCFNWEWDLLTCSMYSLTPAKIIYTPLTSAGAEQLMREMRTRFGSLMIPNDHFVRELFRDRKTPQVIAITGDQVPIPGSKQYWTPFLHRPTAFYESIERLAQLLGYPVYFMKSIRVSRGYFRVEFVPIPPGSPGATVHAILNGYTRILEEEIRRDPANWLWSHRRWKHPPPVSQGKEII